MALSVEIDKRSGFCGGVIRAISKAEEFLDANPGKKLYSLGAIVHNEAELERLGRKGLVTIGKDDIRNIQTPENETVLIRAHGEPPSTYELAREVGINVIDCTCPVVLKLQRSIRESHSRLNIGLAEPPEGAGAASPDGETHATLGTVRGGTGAERSEASGGAERSEAVEPPELVSEAAKPAEAARACLLPTRAV